MAAAMSLVRRYVHEGGGKIALASMMGRETASGGSRCRCWKLAADAQVPDLSRFLRGARDLPGVAPPEPGRLAHKLFATPTPSKRRVRVCSISFFNGHQRRDPRATCCRSRHGTARWSPAEAVSKEPCSVPPAPAMHRRCVLRAASQAGRPRNRCSTGSASKHGNALHPTLAFPRAATVAAREYAHGILVAVHSPRTRLC